MTEYHRIRAGLEFEDANPHNRGIVYAMTDLQIVTREQAKASGLSKFFVAEPCKIGHVAPKYVANGKCAECQRLEARERYWKNPGAMRARALAFARKPENKPKIAARARIYKKDKPTTFYLNRKREQEAGRPRPLVCELCSKPNQIDKPIYWDHCHATGSFRGWICHRCNTILGKVDDSPDLLRKMADYLERTSIG